MTPWLLRILRVKKKIYDILANFPFTSESKRMGIVVRHKATKRLVFFLKGADVAIVPRVKYF